MTIKPNPQILMANMQKKTQNTKQFYCSKIRQWLMKKVNEMHHLIKKGKILQSAVYNSAILNLFPEKVQFLVR